LLSDLMTDRIMSNAIPEDNYVLDGYPRKLTQALKFKKIDFVFYLEVSDEESIRRILARGEGRRDDNEETVKVRLENFREETKPLVHYYEELGILRRIDGEQKIEKIFSDLTMIVSKKFS